MCIASFARLHKTSAAFPPYGYLKDPTDKNRLILDPAIVPIKKDIYRWLVQEGMSLNGAAHRLNAMGIPNPTAYKRSLGWAYQNPHAKNNDGMWTGSGVRRMILDRMNLGHMVQGKQRVVSYKVHDKVRVPEDEWFVCENTHEATFSAEEYADLERVLTRDTRAPNGGGVVHLFAGFLKCADCGKALQRKTSKEHVYYACRTYTEKSKLKCTKHAIRLDILEQAVLATIQQEIALLDDIEDLLAEIDQQEVADQQSDRLQKMIAEKQRELDKLRGISDGLFMDWKNGDISRDEYHRLKERFAMQAEQVSDAIANLEDEKLQLEKSITGENAVLARFRKHSNVQQLDRNLLVELVDTIYIHEGKKITVHFRFPEEVARLTAIARQSQL